MEWHLLAKAACLADRLWFDGLVVGFGETAMRIGMAYLQRRTL